MPYKLKNGFIMYLFPRLSISVALMGSLPRSVFLSGSLSQQALLGKQKKGRLHKLFHSWRVYQKNWAGSVLFISVRSVSRSFAFAIFKGRAGGGDEFSISG